MSKTQTTPYVAFNDLAPMLSVAQIAEYMGVHSSSVHRWIASGDLTAYKAGKKMIRVHRADFLNFFHQLTPSEYVWNYAEEGGAN